METGEAAEPTARDGTASAGEDQRSAAPVGAALAAAVELARPVNLAIVAVGVVAGALVAAGTDVPLLRTGLAVVVAVLATAGGNTLNDWTDRAVDRRAHPGRALPSGRISADAALALAAAEFAVALSLAWFVTLPAFLLALVNGATLAAYEGGLKRRGLAGNLAISYLVGSVFLFGALAADPSAAGPALVLFALAFLANLAREVVKDVQDVEADRAERRTLPMAAGTGPALAFAALALVLAVLLSPAPAWLGWGAGYLVPVAVADVLLLAAVPLSVRDPARASTAVKAGMAVGLAAFLVGATGLAAGVVPG